MLPQRFDAGRSEKFSVGGIALALTENWRPKRDETRFASFTRSRAAANGNASISARLVPSRKKEKPLSIGIPVPKGLNYLLATTLLRLFLNVWH